MNEAFAYSLVKDDSIDTPVCTSDTFLRRFVTTPEAEVFQTAYSKVRAWASPSQIVALEGLSKFLELEGESRLADAYARFGNIRIDTDSIKEVKTIRFVRLAKSIVLAQTLRATGSPALKSRFAELLQAESRNPLRD
jgi:hypothetical protein